LARRSVVFFDGRAFFFGGWEEKEHRMGKDVVADMTLQ
jgi:hypothetical protein